LQINKIKLSAIGLINMHKIGLAFLSIYFLLLTYSCNSQSQDYKIDENLIISHTVDLSKQALKFYWQNNSNENFGSIAQLQKHIEAKQEQLVFAMNGGMYNKDGSPQGLFIENGIIKAQIDTTKNGYGNFYLQPNGIFYLTKDNKAFINSTEDFGLSDNIAYATQSGPMLLDKGKYHPALKKGSENLHIRNGVGVLNSGEVIFAMSKEKINFYDFATYFKQIGCRQALYLDGFVSRMYLPEKNWVQLDGNFGVFIGEIKKAKK